MKRWMVLVGGFILAFLVGTGITYVVLWHLQGLGKVTAEDNPAVVLGAFACVEQSIFAGLIATGLFIVYLVMKSHRRSRA